MARLLVATVPLTGHVAPMALVVRALVARGHEVRWSGGARFAATIAATGATYEPLPASADFDDRDLERALPALRGRRGVARVKAELREMFIAPMAAQRDALAALADAHGPALLLADSAHLGAAALAETRALPWVSLGVSALGVPSVDTAPFGPGWRPGRGWLGRLRNRALHALVHGVMFRDITRAYRAARVGLGLPAGAASYFDVISPTLHLQPTVPGFEYPRRDLPPQVAFIGPLVPPAPAAATLPTWWPDVLAARARGAPVVLVTQGTLATEPGELLAPALAALADLDGLVVATTGREDVAGLGAIPANARVAAFVPYAAVLPLAAVMVTNAGYGGVQMALQHGVPLVAAGGSEEKPEIAARIAWSGVGLDLRTGRPRPAAIRRAVTRILGGAEAGRYRERARAIAAEMAAYGGAQTAAERIEALLAGPRA